MKFSNDLAYWLAAARLEGIGPAKLKRFLEKFELKELLTAAPTTLIGAGASAGDVTAIQSLDWKAVEQDLAWCEYPGNTVLTLNDPGYPRLLQEIHSAPLVLFLQGEPSLLDSPQLAIVGTRNPTASGKDTAKEFAYSLARAGLTITSGLALGIDAECHIGALAADGTTVAVMGTGLNHIYPKSNKKLAARIREQGVLVSEFPPNIEPIARHFPRRNRIISGLSLGVVVVEAAARSGSLITARFALEQGREVFSIPGSIHNVLTRGCHQLIKQGAKLVEKVEDILEELTMLAQLTGAAGEKISSQPAPCLDEKNAYLLRQIGYEATPMDRIIMRSGLTAGEVSSMLLVLELRGYVQSVGGGYTRLSPPNKRQSVDNNEKLI